jgi:hypothetical protein
MGSCSIVHGFIIPKSSEAAVSFSTCKAFREHGQRASHRHRHRQLRESDRRQAKLHLSNFRGPGGVSCVWIIQYQHPIWVIGVAERGLFWFAFP